MNKKTEVPKFSEDRLLYKGNWNYSILKKIVFDTNLSPQARFMYVVLKSFVNPEEEIPTAFPSIEYLCKIIGKRDKAASDETVRSHINELIQYGYLTKKQEKSGNNQYSKNIYTLIESPYPNFPGTENTVTENSSTKNNHLIKKEEEENKDTSPYYIKIEDIENDAVNNIIGNWNIIALANNLDTVEQIKSTEIELIEEFRSKYKIDDLKKEIDQSSYLRGTSKAGKKTKLTFQDLLYKTQLVQNIFVGKYRDSNNKPSELFEDSIYADDKERYIKDMKKDPLFQEYKGADIGHYWAAVASYSRRKKKKSTDWIAEGINFMKLDKESGTFWTEGGTIETNKDYQLPDDYGS